eukprot:5526503-Alexandrium_andersonii.AAC.1
MCIRDSELAEVAHPRPLANEVRALCWAHSGGRRAPVHVRRARPEQPPHAGQRSGQAPRLRVPF